MIFIERDTALSQEEIYQKIQVLKDACDTGDDLIAKEALRSVVPTFKRPEDVNKEISLISKWMKRGRMSCLKKVIKFEKFESKVWLSSPTMHGPEIEYVKEAYETNWMSTVGKNINEVERMACEYIGCKYAVALSAGTASLHLAMKLAGIEAYGMPKVGHGALEGKKVFCSDMTFDATVNPVVYEGGEPVFIDTEYDTWNMDPVALEKSI